MCVTSVRCKVSKAGNALPSSQQHKRGLAVQEQLTAHIRSKYAHSVLFKSLGSTT